MQNKLEDMERKQEVQDGREITPCDSTKNTINGLSYKELIRNKPKL